MIKKILLLPKTYRIDILILVFLLSFYSFFEKNISSSVLLSLFFSLIPFNYIYTINFITDVKEDSINKPERIDLIDRIGKKIIFIYSVLLLILGILIPSLFFTKKILFISMTIMLGGSLYSLEPFRAKRNISGNIIVLIVALSLIINRMTQNNIVFLSNFFFYAFLMMVFKDINDVKGDKKAKVFNWMNLNLPMIKIISFLNMLLLLFNLLRKSYIFSVFSLLNFYFIKKSYIKNNYVYLVCIFLLIVIINDHLSILY